MKQINEEADADKQVVQLSTDAKTSIKVGRFARASKSRVLTKAVGHDFYPQARVTPVDIFLPASDGLFLYGVTSKVTSDCLVDRLVDWWETVKERFSYIKPLLINLDNGTENYSWRAQIMQRLVDVVQHYRYDPLGELSAVS